MSDWPEPSAPGHPGKVGIYFGRYIGGAQQPEVCYTNFMEPWQLGRFLEELFGDPSATTPLEQEEDWYPQFTYSFVLERDAVGEPVRSRTFWMRIVGTTMEDAFKAAKNQKYSKIELPYVANMWLNACRGHGLVSRVVVITDKLTPASAPTKRSEPRERKQSVPRPRGDDIVALQDLCAEHKVEPKDVRGLLRKRNIEKPGGGWAWPKGDERIAGIIKVIEAVKRGEKK